MKGKILGCDSSGVVINGEDGNRYLSTLADWRGQRAPQANDQVDFVAAGNKATDVFLLGGSISFAPEKIDTAAANKALGVLRDRPQVILAVVALLASFFLPFVQVTTLSPTPAWQSTAVGIPGKVATIRAAASDSIKAASDALAEASQNNFNAGSFAGAIAAASLTGGSNDPAIAKEKLDQAKGALALSQLVVLIFLIPAGAVAILFLEFRQARNRLVELGTGVVGILCVGAAFYAREVVANYVNKMMSVGAESVKQAFQVGAGGWLIVAASIGLVATALGYLKRTPGIPG